MNKFKKLVLGCLVLGITLTYAGINVSSKVQASDSAYKKSNPYGTKSSELLKQKKKIEPQKGLAKQRLAGINYHLEKFEPNTVKYLKRGEFGNLYYGDKNVIVYFSEAPCKWGEQVISYIDSLSNDETYANNYTFNKRSLHADHVINSQEQVNAINDFMSKCHPPYCIINTKTNESLTISGSAPYAAKTMRTVFGAAKNW